MASLNRAFYHYYFETPVGNEDATYEAVLFDRSRIEFITKFSATYINSRKRRGRGAKHPGIDTSTLRQRPVTVKKKKKTDQNITSFDTEQDIIEICTHTMVTGAGHLTNNYVANDFGQHQNTHLFHFMQNIKEGDIIMLFHPIRGYIAYAEIEHKQINHLKACTDCRPQDRDGFNKFFINVMQQYGVSDGVRVPGDNNWNEFINTMPNVTWREIKKPFHLHGVVQNPPWFQLVNQDCSSFIGLKNKQPDFPVSYNRQQSRNLFDIPQFSELPSVEQPTPSKGKSSLTLAILDHYKNVASNYMVLTPKQPDDLVLQGLDQEVKQKEIKQGESDDYEPGSDDTSGNIGNVYFMRSKTNELSCLCKDKHIDKCPTLLVKIGMTTRDPKKRCVELRAGNPGLYVYKHISTNNYKKLEKFLQSCFSSKHHSLEWYFLTDDEIDSLVDFLKV
jgi:hypothetical protein